MGKELQCVNQRLAGGDPLCDAIMRAVRDGLVWVGGCDETEERGKMESSHMQLQDTDVCARMNTARRLVNHGGRVEDEGEAEDESEAQSSFLLADGSQQLTLVCWNLRRFTGPSGATIPVAIYV